jgi:hypothetical protein
MKVLWAVAIAGVALSVPATHASAATLTVCNYSDSEVSDIFIQPHPKGMPHDKHAVARNSCTTITEIPSATYKIDLYAGFDCRSPVNVTGNATYIFDQPAKDRCDHEAMESADY